jgi:peptidoglycan-N-acetylglucosamine deacetylase
MATTFMHKLTRSLVQRTVGTITHFAIQEAVAALTFDDGPHPEYTPPLLDILEKYGARATFFMLGKSAQRYPDIVKSVAERGHAIGNHSWDHPSFPSVDRAIRRKQIRLCQEAILPYGQCLFRPPFGHQNWWSMLEARMMGYEIVTWNVAGMDWMDRDGLWIADFVTPKVTPGCIILLHDALHNFMHESYRNRTPTLEAVELLLQRLSNRIQFIIVPEMFYSGKPRRRIKISKGDLKWLNKLKIAKDEARNE